MRANRRLVISCLVSVLFAGPAVPCIAASGRGSTRAELQAAYAAMDRAWKAQDARRLLAYVTPDFVWIGEDGEVMGPARVVPSVEGPGVLITHRLGSVSAKGREAVAEVTLRGYWMAATPDGPVGGGINLRVRDTWVRTPGGWRLKRRDCLTKRGEPVVPDTGLPLQRVWRVSDPALTGIAQASPADPSLAILTREGEIRRIDMQGKPLGTLSQPGEQATSLAYSPDGARLMAGTKSGKALVWDLRAGTCRVAFEGAGGPVSRVAWLPGADLGVLTIPVPHEELKEKPSGFVFDLSNGRATVSFRASAVTDYQTLAVSTDGRKVGVLDVPDRERGAFLLNAASGAVGRAFCHASHADGPLSLAIAPDGSTLAVGYAPYDVILWDVAGQRAIRALEGHSNWVVSLAFSPDGKTLVSGAGDSTARVWSAATGKELGRARLSGDCDYVKSVGFSHDGRLIFAATENGQVIVVRAPGR